MGIALIKIKIMPESPDTDLGEIEKKAEEIISEQQGENIKIEKQPVAFGLNAVITTFSRNEELDTDNLLETLRKIQTVNSAEIIDFRRALG